jgi:NAD(P)-dependent dehydrogenase (short-subunit alcohol dehydrogenase family)
MSDITFDGRVAVVTGAGGGLGKTYALELARRGAKVVVNDLGGSVFGFGGATSAADAVVEEINEMGGEAVANYDSVSTAEGGTDIVKAAVDAFGTVDIVVNNAGILRDKSFANMSHADVEAVLAVHLLGAFHVSRPAFSVMKEKGYGRFVFTSSAAGIFGNFGQANYGAAKMGLVGLMNVLAVEGAKYNIKANAIAPIAKTRMTEDLLAPLAAMVGRPLDELINPSQVTPLVVYLCSEECEHTHEVFSVGGGRFARIFVGVNKGWFAGVGQVPTAEEVRDHMGDIRDVSAYAVPGNVNEETAMLLQLMQG